MANNTMEMFGSYAPDPDPKYVTTPLDGLRNIAHEVRFAAGCKDSDTRCTAYNTTDITVAVNGTDIVFVFLGTGQTLVPLLFYLKVIDHNNYEVITNLKKSPLDNLLLA